jgi:hypothetical protein
MWFPTLLRTPPPQFFPHGTLHISQPPRSDSAKTKVDDGHDAKRPAGLQATPKRLNCCRLPCRVGMSNSGRLRSWELLLFDRQLHPLVERYLVRRTSISQYLQKLGIPITLFPKLPI